jgi:hypothetical protein
MVGGPRSWRASASNSLAGLFGRRAVVALGAVPLLAALVLTPSANRGADAATPPSGTIGESNASVQWQGQLYPLMSTAVPEACPPTADPLNVRCDHYTLTVDVPPSYWDTHTGGADVAIEWGSADNDFDLFVYDGNGTLVAESASGGTTSERAFIQNPSGAYEVRVVPFLVVASDYKGTATFVSTDGGPAPNPSRSSGGLAFGPATVIDAQRTEGEPVNHIDANGNYWESGPYGTSTQLSFIHRSTDGGDQFNIVSPVGLRPDLPPGGGDTDVTTDDQGNAYFVDLEGLINLGVAVSNDDGNTWRKNALGIPTAADDRQWFAADNGPTALAADNTVFLAYRQVPTGSYIYSTPGSTGAADPVGGLLYTNASADPVNAVSTGAPCGQLRFDPVKRNLYYACASGDHLVITVGHVNPGQRSGIAFHNVNTPASPGGVVGDIFPAVATDKAGNVYAVWIDEATHDVYYAFSTDAGASWSDVRQVNGNDANSNVFPRAIAGDAGTLAVAWYGSPSHLDSDNMPSWFNNRPAASQYKWYGYVSLITGAATASPSYAQQRFTEKPMHYGQICNGGLGCTTSDGDRTMADFFAIAFDRDGALRFVYNDTTSQHHGAHLFEARQIAGPTAKGTTISKALPASPVADPTGDARSPHYAPGGAGANLAQYDFTKLAVSQPNADTLRVQMTVANLASRTPPPGKTNGVWLTRFQALSVGDGGEEAYRIFYVGAESAAGGVPTFFAGSGASAQGNVPGNGCVTTTPENCKIVEYPREVSASGSISGNTITIDVPLQDGFGANRPIVGDQLFSVTGLTAGRSNDTDVYADVDATRAFDFRLGSVEPPVVDSPCKINGGGQITGASGGDATFSISLQPKETGKVDYRDGSAAKFHSTRITGVTCDPSAGTATIEGTGVDKKAQVTFTVRLTDGGATDEFAIELSSGYSASGQVSGGDIKVR